MSTMEDIRSAAQELGERYGVERIYLFGSYARGSAVEDSDIDLRLDKGRMRGLFQLAGLQLALEDRLGKKVDLLPSDSLDERFLSRIRGEEIMIYGAQGVFEQVLIANTKTT